MVTKSTVMTAYGDNEKGYRDSKNERSNGGHTMNPEKDKAVKTSYMAPVAIAIRVALDEVIAYSPVRGAVVENWAEVTPDASLDGDDITLPF
jgi:hypothetical protein